MKTAAIATLAVFASRASALENSRAVEKSQLDPAVEKQYGYCSHLHDGDCDDGGYGSEYSLCNFGSDEPDCGRFHDPHSHWPHDPHYHSPHFHSPHFHSPHFHSPHVHSPHPVCSHQYDGDCDDGGFGSEYSLCPFGTDSHDCGSCTHESDGDCDDGGYGSEFSLCPYGRDEPDCGRHQVFRAQAPGDKAHKMLSRPFVASTLVVVGIVGVLVAIYASKKMASSTVVIL